MIEHVQRNLHTHLATIRDGRWVCKREGCDHDFGVKLGLREPSPPVDVEREQSAVA